MRFTDVIDFDDVNLIDLTEEEKEDIDCFI